MPSSTKAPQMTTKKRKLTTEGSNGGDEPHDEMETPRSQISALRQRGRELLILGGHTPTNPGDHFKFEFGDDVYHKEGSLQPLVDTFVIASGYTDLGLPGMVGRGVATNNVPAYMNPTYAICSFPAGRRPPESGKETLDIVPQHCLAWAPVFGIGEKVGLVRGSEIHCGMLIKDIRKKGWSDKMNAETAYADPLWEYSLEDDPSWYQEGDIKEVVN